MKKSTFRIPQVLVVVLSSLVISACMESVTPPSEDSAFIPIEQVVKAPVSVTELELGFRRSDPTDIVYVLNEVKKSPPNVDVIQRVSCAYIACNREANDWSWEDLSNPIVRISLIDVLIQAKHRGIDTVDQEALKAEAVTVLSNDNPLVVQRSLMILAYLNISTDVPMIEIIAMQTKNDVTFRVAIIALIIMSNQVAKAAIDEILKKSTAERRALIAE